MVKRRQPNPGFSGCPLNKYLTTSKKYKGLADPLTIQRNSNTYLNIHLTWWTTSERTDEDSQPIVFFNAIVWDNPARVTYTMQLVVLKPWNSDKKK